MAVMASETPLDPVSFPEKAQPLSSSTSIPAPAQVNGDSNHHDTILEDPATTHNGTNHVTSEAQPTMSLEDNAPPKTLAAEDASAAPVEHVAPGITPMASFLPELEEPVPSAADPPATSTEPPVVEAPISSVRDDPLPETQASAPSESIPEPSSMIIQEPPTLSDKIATQAEDTMDVSEDLPPQAAQSVEDADVMMGDAIDDSEPAANPGVSDVVMTLPGASAPTPPAEAQETVVTGQVRQREEDEESEPVAKRAKTESEEEGIPIASSDVPVPSTESALATPQDVTPAPVAPAAPAAVMAPLEPPPLDSSPLTKIQQKFLVEQIRKAKKTKSAVAFLKPVDYVALNIPTYIEVIKKPMDLSTMEDKLKSDQYATADELMADFTTMVQNCLTFNGANHPVSVAALNLKAYWDKCMLSIPKGAAAQAAVKPPKPEPAPPKVTRPARTSTIPVAPPPPPTPAAAPPATVKSPTEPAGFLDEHGNPMIRRTSTAQTDRPKREIIPPKRDLPYSGVRPKKKKAQLELKFCEVVLQELNKKKHSLISFPFMAPVDPVALNIPHYHRIIKKPMDFGTIANKLKVGEYANAKEFHADAKLVFANCYKFNPANDEVHRMGKQFEDVFDKEWENKDAWLASNQPQSEPPSEDEEEEEEEEPVEDVGLRRMQEIQAQIAALSAEAMQLTQANVKRPSPKAASKKAAKATTTKKAAAPKATTASAPKASKPKAKAKAPKKLTMEQKREVSEGIANLDEAKMRKAVNIIRAGVPHLASVQDDELELDIDEIPDEVVYKLWEFVRSSLPKKEREPSPDYDDELDDEYVSASKPTAQRKKNKPMKAKEQEERIAQLKEKLSGGAGSGSSASPTAAHHETDDEASEESEEE